MESIIIDVVISGDIENVFKFWTDSRLHTSITGSTAKINGKEGGKFTCWDDYISGSFVEIDHPMLLGQGIPLFKGVTETTKLKLKETKTFSCGVIALHYKTLALMP